MVQLHSLSIKSTLFGDVKIRTGPYLKNGAMAVELLDQNLEALTMLSTNLVDETDLLGPNEFFAKNWDYNESIAKDALASGLFVDTGRMARFYIAPIWRFCP